MGGRSKYDGFGALWIVLAVLVLLAAGYVGWLVYQRARAPAVSNINTHQTQNQTTQQTKSANEFVISEFNVKMTLPDSLTTSDLTYVIDRSVAGAVSANFTTHTLLAKDSGCTAREGAIGIIGQTTIDPMHADEHKIGNYYYAFYAPQGSCTGGTLEQTQAAALKQAFATLSAAN